MHILTFNIHGWRTIDGQPNLDGVAAVIQATGADIVGLNEVFYPRTMAGSDEPALASLATRLGMHFVFGPCLRWPAQDNMPAAAFGNALLSRWPIIASSAHHLTPKEEDQKGLLADKEQRGLLEGRILLPDRRLLTVYVTHLDNTDEAVRAIQLRVARTWLVRDRRRPHLVLGDFNTVSLWDFAGREQEVDALAAGRPRTPRHLWRRRTPGGGPDGEGRLRGCLPSPWRSRCAHFSARHSRAAGGLHLCERPSR